MPFREGSIHDLEQCMQLGIASYQQYSQILTAENWEKLNGFLHDKEGLANMISKYILFVCESENKIVGMAFFIPSGNPFDIYQDDWSYIRYVGVHPGHTKKGVGKKLVEMCIEKAKELNEKIITLHTSEFMQAAIHLYESLGFTILKEIPPRFGKRYWLYKLELE
jgi:ribosomal protein S18 acetylase RimI-like enzyme